MNLFQQAFGNTPATDLRSLINDGAFLVDVRTPGEFAEGNVKGSVNIPLDTIASQLQQFNGHKNIIVFCRSGARSTQARAILAGNGITNVINGGSWDYIDSLLT